MSLGIVDRALPQITYSGGNKELETVVSVTVNETDEKTPVETMNRAREPIGYTRGVKKTDLDLEVAILQGEPDVDWRRLKDTGEKFLFSWEEEGGNRLSARDCVVDSLSTPYTKDGEVRRSVKLKALGIREEP